MDRHVTFGSVLFSYFILFFSSCVIALKLNREDIKEVSSVKYHGHIIYKYVLDDRDVMRKCQQLYACSNVIHCTREMLCACTDNMYK